MKSVGLTAAFVEVLFWVGFAYFVLQDPDSFDFLPKEFRKSLRRQSDFHHVLAISMILTGLLWMYGVCKNNRGYMIPNQILSALLNVALFIICIIAPIWVVIMHIAKVEYQSKNLFYQIRKTFFEDETIKEIENGQIFLKLFMNALPSIIYGAFTSMKCSLYRSIGREARNARKADDTQLSLII